MKYCLLSESQVSDLLGISLSKLRQDRHFHRGIPYVKIGRSVRYAEADVQAFVEARRIVPENKEVWHG